MISIRTSPSCWSKGVKRPPAPINVLAKSDAAEGTTYIGGGLSAGWLDQRGRGNLGQSLGHDHRRPARRDQA